MGDKLNLAITDDGYNESYQSLSGFHDFEPELEFDDLVEKTPCFAAPVPPEAAVPLPPELAELADESAFMTGSPSDGIFEENFEKELASIAPASATWQLGFDSHQPDNNLEIDNRDSEYIERLVQSQFIEIVGNDHLGRMIVVISACRLPPSAEVPPDRMLKYLVNTLDKFVEQDYLIVYYHYGLTSASRPPMSWFWNAYGALDRKFKKNLKGLYLVHPTGTVKIVWQMFKPVISTKFGRKMAYVNYLHKLTDHGLRLEQLPVPDPVKEHDQRLLGRNPRAAAEAAAVAAAARAQAGGNSCTSEPTPPLTPKKVDLVPTQQFGVSLEFISEHNPDMKDHVPPVVRYCVDFLSKPENLQTEGIFRRSTSQTTLDRMIAECNRGETVQFNDDPHCAAALLKAFLRYLEDPVLTHRLFDEIVDFGSWPIEKRGRNTKILLCEKLPMENYRLLKYIVQFLWRVQEMSCLNKMNVNNLAVVFGPAFLWPPIGRLSMQYVYPINNFTEYLLKNNEELFMI